ncbi:hypothetical protein JAAARDRAFT_54549 [Jaapia argillacea MUCL 33604]|uniref:Rhodanese domain-containing protein n=1 Tax=Jaapia argillacea MUCL 33604 TaxID=933084 RepID=A0A067Q6M6_9AGAM|nr:hypothetical protein JAAARDRAFT_54549 [Jaapia argillacea MUCL 33604]
MSFRYITPDDLTAIIKSDKVPNKDYVVIDVRDDDWHGGNIKGSHNFPSQTFLAKVDELVEKTKNVKTVIFHCLLSQMRGPKAARIYSEVRDMMQAEGADNDHEVLVLQGGFEVFQAKFKDDPELVENFNKEVWTTEYL